MMEGINPPQVENLSLLFKNCFSIPVFQRPYSWGSEEISELFTDINEYFNDDSADDLFMGTVYMALDGQVKSSIIRYSIVDGQQRITTLALTCLILYHYAVKYGFKKDDAVINLKNFLWKKTDGREPDRNAPILSSSSLEQKAMKFIFDTVFDDAGEDTLFETISSYKIENKQEERIINNVKIIDSKISNYLKNGGETLLEYIDFLIENLQFITITVGKGKEKKLFEIFESINSKGKKLDEIDLIKSYIFQNIDGDYDKYLNIWGELIKETDDNLEDYLYVFIESFIKFYKVGLSNKYFKKLDKDLMNYYGVDNLSDALKSLLSDMHKKVRYYKKMLCSDEYLIENNEFKFYTACLRLLEYKHPKPVIFRSYCEFELGELDKRALAEVIKACFVYMFSFQTISDRDSKDAIKAFELIMDSVFESGYDYQKIISTFRNSLIANGVDAKSLEDKILKFVGFTETKEKMASRILLAAYEFSKDGKIDYDKALYAINNSDTIQIDHILPQTPKEDDKNCQYYIEKQNDERILRLKPGHDFNIPGISSGMDYELFRAQVLDRIGNLRLMWRHDNVDKSNTIVELKDYSTFNTYSKISKRAQTLSKGLSENEIFTV